MGENLKFMFCRVFVKICIYQISCIAWKLLFFLFYFSYFLYLLFLTGLVKIEMSFVFLAVIYRHHTGGYGAYIRWELRNGCAREIGNLTCLRLLIRSREQSQMLNYILFQDLFERVLFPFSCTQKESLKSRKKVFF